MAGRWKRKVGIGVLMIAALLAIGITFTGGAGGELQNHLANV